MLSSEIADRITKAVLYEGYLLYPYTPKATKNRQRWTFGCLYPHRYVERCPIADSPDTHELQSQLLIEAEPGAKIEARLRFLQLFAHATGEETDAWEEAVEREIDLPPLDLKRLALEPFTHDFGIAPILGRIELRAKRVEGGTFRLSTQVRNLSVSDPKDRGEALPHSLVSTHLLFSASGGIFVSLIDPPERYRRAALQCRNRATWPVLLGKPGDLSLMLSAPIILSDYPQVAPESPGDLFDGGEIDEILTLRILTLTDQEKDEIRKADERGRAMLERTEKLTNENLLHMHGAWRTPEGRPKAFGELTPGKKVKIRPRRSSDVFDLVLSGKTATIRSIEQDLEGRYYLNLAIDDDPGRDLEVKAQLGHRFFFRPEDVEPL